jgi:hypothetical protein
MPYGSNCQFELICHHTHNFLRKIYLLYLQVTLPNDFGVFFPLHIVGYRKDRIYSVVSIIFRFFLNTFLFSVFSIISHDKNFIFYQ